MKSFFNHIIIFALFLAGGGGIANSTSYNASAEIDSTNLLMGTLTNLSVRVEKPEKGKKINFPLLENGKGRPFIGLLNDSIELSQPKIDTVAIDNKEFVAFNFKVQAFDSGRYVLPPFELIIGQDTARTNQLSLNVIPVKVKADDEIDPFSDVAQPFEITMKDGANKEKTFWEKLLDYWWLILLGILLVGAVVYAIWKYKTTGSVLPVKKPLPPYEQALNAMKSLQEKQLWEKGRDKEYYTGLVDILRQYLLSQYGIKAMEMTTRQLMKAMKRVDVLRINRELIKPVLDLSDVVKFAKQRPDAQENEEMFDRSLNFLHNTRPVTLESNEEGGAK